MPFKKGKTPKGAKPFQKGQSGNPKGRPRGSKNRATQLRKWLDLEATFPNRNQHGGKIFEEMGENVKITVEDEVDLALIQEARKGNIRAIQEIKDSIYGKLKDTIEIQTAPPEIEAAQSLYESLRENGFTKTKAVNEVIKGARANGYELKKADILDAETIS